MIQHPVYRNIIGILGTVDIIGIPVGFRGMDVIMVIDIGVLILLITFWVVEAVVLGAVVVEAVVLGVVDA
jgi:hypothetical protein